MQSKFRFATATLIAAALCVSSTTAAVASVPATAIAIATNCAASIGAAGMVAQAPIRPGCVLPVIDAPARAPVLIRQPAPMVSTPVGRRFNVWPVLAGLAAIIGALVLLSGGDDDDDDDDSLSRG